ncbi:hypothetical protein Pmani_032872 [Petrolisthes manimaculis]|uniref:Hexosyltransferase n=1 Tax=Petrolisthes manimaculis TaxID=1843537 RepID=A0AAE1NQV3_9EUCA|nr:hypothetical protein Pmani_032872 [Petrolisthes manimaculis]
MTENYYHEGEKERDGEWEKENRFLFIHSKRRMNLSDPRRQQHDLLNDLRFHHDPSTNICKPENSPLVVALVITAPQNEEKRNFIRKTWGNPDLYKRTKLKAVFVIGQVNNNNDNKQQQQHKINQEHNKYNDIVQYNFIDSYNNLTYKSLALLTWATSRCNEVPFLLKVDDDVLVNPYHLKKFLVLQLTEPPTPKSFHKDDEWMSVPQGSNPATCYIYGRYDSTPYPLRVTKWALTMDEYPEKFFPSFVHGPAYIVGSVAARELLKFAPYVPIIKLEDVYVTGLVAYAAKIKHVQIFNNINTFRTVPGLYNGTQAILEENGPKTREEAWKNISKLALDGKY